LGVWRGRPEYHGQGGRRGRDTSDYLGWITGGFAMSNDGQYYNSGYGGEVYYNQPSTLGAVRFIDALVHKWKVMPEGVTDASAVTTAFCQGRTAMTVLPTGSLSFVRESMMTAYRVALLPRALKPYVDQTALKLPE
jgi:sn-glycerol 3-phosphate transport system substrate-binding protein